MTLLGRLGSTATAGATFAANFWPWLLATLLLGLGLGGGGGFQVAKWIYQGEALKAEKNLAEFDASLAKATAEGERQAAARQAEALGEIAARNVATDEALAKIPDQVAAMLAPKFLTIREQLNDPKFACLREPYPPPALRLLERPGGVAPEARRDPSPPADPGGLPH